MYSQNSEERVILDYFSGFTGTALDCGANDGILLSNSRALIELGWNAVLVEPAEMPFAKLVQNNIPTFRLPEDKALADIFKISGGWMHRDGSEQRVHCINAAITTQDGPLEFYSSGTHLKKGDTDLLSTSKPEELERWRKSGEVFTKTNVRGITFETLMRETGVRKFDFISVDAEGADWDIVKQIDLTAVGCRMLCVEVNARGDGVFTDYAGQFGMRLHWRSHENRIYVK